MKSMVIIGLMALLVGCESDAIRFERAQGLTLETELEARQFESSDVVSGEESNSSTIKEDLETVGVLLGLGETRGAEMELYSVIETIEAQGENPGDYEQVTYYQQLLQSSEEDAVEIDPNHNHDFTGYDAVTFAIEEYGADNDDLVYLFDENFEHYGDDQIGYYVALKSLEQEAQGEEGIVLLLFVGEDGSITEIY